MPKFAGHVGHVAQVMAASAGLGFAGGEARGAAAGLRSLLEAVGRAHGVASDHLLAGRKLKRLAVARQDFMWRARQVRAADGARRYSLPMIARFLGLKDHTTILWGARRHQARLEGGR